MAAHDLGTSTETAGQIFSQLEAYPWSEDSEFQGGLTAILGPNPSPAQADELTLRARCFYYSRKYDVPIDFSAYKDWRLQHHNPSLNTNRTTSNGISTTEADRSHTTTTAQSSTNPPAPYPPTFTQIVDLITTGQPIPGIKDIPDIVLAGQETQPTTAKRKKPWEKDSVDVVADGNRDDLGAEPL